MGRPRSPDVKTIQAVDRAIEILRSFSSERPALTAGELQKTLKLSRGTLYRMLNTLQVHGLVKSVGEPQRFSLDMEDPFAMRPRKRFRYFDWKVVSVFASWTSAARIHFVSTAALVQPSISRWGQVERCGSIAIFSPEGRMNAERIAKLAPRVMEAGRLLSKRLGAPDYPPMAAGRLL
jgi:hypothetical protein